MNIRSAAAAAFVAVCLASANAYAATQTLSQAGVWKAYGGTSDNGTPICGMSTQQGNRYFSVRLYANTTEFEIQMGTSDWNMQKGEKVEVTLRFDGYTPWNGRATGFTFGDGDGGLWFTVRRSGLDQFVQEFRDANALRIQFAGSNLSDWTVNLAGSSAVYVAFQDCTRRLR